MDLLTFSELERVARDEILARNSALTKDAVERPGTDVNALVGGITAGVDDVTGQLAAVQAALYLDSAQEQKLDRFVFDRYGLLRKQAAVALGTVAFRTATTNLSPFAIPLGTQLATADGKQFVTSAAATFPSGTSGPVSVSVRSVLAGLDQQAAIGTITSLVSRPTGSPNDLTVTNTVATAGAADREADEDLRARARAFWTSARRGTLGAIETQARATPGVKTASVFETIDPWGRPAKAAELVVTDAFTDQLATVAPTPLAYMAQSQVLADAVFANLSDTRGAGIYISVRVAQVVLTGVQLGLRFRAGVDYDATALRARAIVVATLNALAPGAALRVGSLLAALATIPELEVTGAEIISPAGDVVAQPLQVLRTSLALVLALGAQADRQLQANANPDAV